MSRRLNVDYMSNAHPSDVFPDHGVRHISDSDEDYALFGMLGVPTTIWRDQFLEVCLVESRGWIATPRRGTVVQWRYSVEEPWRCGRIVECVFKDPDHLVGCPDGEDKSCYIVIQYKSQCFYFPYIDHRLIRPFTPSLIIYERINRCRP